MKKNRAFFLVFLLLLLPQVANPDTPDQSRNMLKVCVIDNKDKIYLVLKGAYKIYAINSDRVVMEGPRLRANSSAIKNGIRIGKKEIKGQGFRIRPYKDQGLYVDGKRFRGGIDIMPKDDTAVLVINNIDIEDYLYGVLYHEVSHRWPMEVLKAQAIAARTFALYQKAQNKAQPYDLRSDIYSQVYGGSGFEKWATTKAVNVTRGMVLTYENKVLPAYYHATCAGHTEDASNLWNVDIPPLEGGPCDFCARSPHYKWTAEIPLWELKSELKKSGYNIGRVSSVNILSRNKSGRVEKMEVKDEAGASVMMTGKDFRQMLGPNKTRSTKFDLVLKWNHLVLKGTGWGHGVGMCQWGAFGQARKGRKCEEILRYYYPGTEITTIDKITKE